MQRRAFVVVLGGGLTVPILAAHAQPIKTVGILDPYEPADDFNDQLRLAFNDTGLIDGKTVRFQWRFANGDIARLPALASELVALNVGAIVTVGAPATRAARQATSATPVVAGSDDLVGEGLVASLGWTGGTITGWSILASELNTKRLELLKTMVPAATRIGVLWDPDTGTFHLEAQRRLAAALGVELRIEEVRGAPDLDRAFAALVAWRAQAFNVLASPLLHALRGTIIERVARERLPAIYQWGETAAAGGLMSYGPTHYELLHGMARQLDLVLKGTKAGDLPVEQPTKFKLVINGRTARSLGLAVPPSILARADEVIE
jgi:putative ABC transport system substrate-binding protein